jgi:hypothetical protein
VSLGLKESKVRLALLVLLAPLVRQVLLALRESKVLLEFLALKGRRATQVLLGLLALMPR